MAYSPQVSSDAEDMDQCTREPIPSLQQYLLSNENRTPTFTAASLPAIEDVVSPETRKQLFQSSPLIDKDPAMLKAHRIRKGHKARRTTINAKHASSAKTREELATAHSMTSKQFLDDILDQLAANGVPFADLMDYVFNPELGQGSIRWHEFFVFHGRATQILDWWTSSQNSKSARKEVAEWACNYVAKTVAKEAKAVTKSKELQTRNKTINREFVMSFSFSSIREWLECNTAPTAMKILRAFAESSRPHGERRKEKTNMIITSCALTCLGEYSHANNYSKRMMGLYYYASGVSRQAISVMSTLGICESYTNLITRNIRRVSKESADLLLKHTGTLRQLSESMRKDSRDLARTGLFQEVYDNINMDERSAEQILGRHDSQENGTCATIAPLFDADIEHMKTADFQERFMSSQSLQISDIIHSPDEAKQFKQNLICTILRIIVNYGGVYFKQFEKDLEKYQPQTSDKIAVHKTTLYPLPTMKIDESTIIGNAEVDEAVKKELDLDLVPEAAERIRFIDGDQLSLARLRALELIRGGQESKYPGFFWGVWIPGLFHVKMADAQGTFINHWGKPDTGTRNPGSLWFHNTRLDRMPIVLSSMPSYRVCRDLIFVSCYSRVLHCLLRVSKLKSLDVYSAKGYTWDHLVIHATQIYEQYASGSIASELQAMRENDNLGTEKPGGSNQGDMIFESAIYFLRDSLISREFNDAVKAGDSGRIVLVLKIWALSFRGNGRTKYAYEMLHFIHHLTNVWSKEVRHIILKNWLVNPSGNPNSFLELDLVQEHLNFWIKAYYKAHGANATWEWLEMISPTIEVLRKHAEMFNTILGSDQGTRHAPPDLTVDIQTLMDSLEEHGVYQLKKGRKLDEGEGPAKDVVEIGFHALSQGSKNPLNEYNKAFKRLQTRRSMKPVVDKDLEQYGMAPKSPTQPETVSGLPLPTLDSAQIARSDLQEEPFLHEEVGSDLEMENGEENESAVELDDLLVDIENNKVPTLPCLTEDDVAFDMDTVNVYTEDIEEDESGSEAAEGEDDDDAEDECGVDVEYRDM